MTLLFIHSNVRLFVIRSSYANARLARTFGKTRTTKSSAATAESCELLLPQRLLPTFCQRIDHFFL
jgi:hypothetical protein